MDAAREAVLVVDDDLVISHLLTRILKMAGYDVVAAGDGREALAVFQGETTFGLVVSDLNMPVMDGKTLIRELRAQGSDVPIIVLSANNEIAIALDALNSGANDYVPKDQNLRKTLMISVKRVLEKRRLEVKNRQLMEDIEFKNRQLENEMLLAQKVQENILPKNLTIPGFPTGTFYRPSFRVGGDFFDALDCGDLVHFLIGDISGHNTSSALIMAVCKGMFRSLGQTMSDPLEIVTAANRMLCPLLMENGMFLTLIYLTVARATGKLRLVSAGHNTVYLIADGTITEIASGGPVLGWDPEDAWEPEEHSFMPGNTLFLYTDGLVESKNTDNIPFEDQLVERLLAQSETPGTRDRGPGTAERLSAHSETPAELTARLVAELTAYTGGGFDDDITLFAIGRDADA
jgi:sigma-B regulation protein RsbU (phosphoserine phosphatase)